MRIIDFTKRACKRGFTLIEIMVATVIMVILVGLVIQITSEVLKVWNRSSGRLAANSQARIAMELLTRDLETAVFRSNGLQWLRSENEDVEGPAGTTTATVSLKLFAPALDRELKIGGQKVPGDICAIAYKLAYADPVDGSTAEETPDNRLFILYRLLVDPETTFTELMGKDAPDEQKTLPDASATAWGPSESIIGNQGSNYLVSNIVEFKIDYYVEDDGITSTPTLVGGTSATSVDTILGGTDATVGPNAGGSIPVHFQKPLSYADITLTVISDEGAQMLQNLSLIASEGSDEERINDVITTHGSTFTRRINFLTRPL